MKKEIYVCDFCRTHIYPEASMVHGFRLEGKELKKAQNDKPAASFHLCGFCHNALQDYFTTSTRTIEPEITVYEGSSS
jgi:hypothetical protein